MKIKSLICSILATAMIPAAAMAATDSNKTIATVGTQGPWAYVTFKEALSVGCTYNTIYITDLTQASSRAAYATLLVARSIDNKIGRIDYTVQSDGSCVANLVQLTTP